MKRRPRRTGRSKVYTISVSLGLILIIASCPPPAETVRAMSEGGDAPRTGAYHLISVDGQPLPIDIEEVDGCQGRLTGGQLALRDDHTYGYQTELTFFCADGSIQVDGTSESGSWVRDELRLVLHPAKTLDVSRWLEHTADGAELWFGHTTHALRFIEPIPGEPYDPDDPMLSVGDRTRELIAAQGAHRPTAYDCRTDDVLATAPPTARADTAGLGAKIAARFPGYRLATEVEIVCALVMEDMSSPATHLREHFASGEAWWVLRGDHTKDGREDVVTVAVADDSALPNLLVVLHDNGTGSEIAPLGGSFFAAAVDERGPYILLYTPEMPGTRYYWDGEGFGDVVREY